MPRKLRFEYAGAIYHLINLGDRREPILRDEADRKRLLESLGEVWTMNPASLNLRPGRTGGTIRTGMKPMVWVCLLAAVVTAHARPGYVRYQAPRHYARRSVPQHPMRMRPPPQTPQSAVAQPPAAVAAPPTPMVMAPPPAPTEADLAKAAAEKEAADKRLLDFQRQRAEGGSPSAQYELGLRYLTGNGVEVSLAEARRWLAASANQDNSAAQRKLKELDADSPATLSPAEARTATQSSAKPVATPSL